MFIVELQCFDKAFFQFREKVQRSTEECDIAADRAPLREVADGLIDDRLKNGECNVRLLRTVVHERLNIRLGEHAAARGNRVDTLALFCERIESDGVRREQGCHMVNERAGTACTDTVHALLGCITEIRDLGVLSAKLDRRRCLRNKTTHRRGTGDNLLYERKSDALGNAHARRPRECKREFCLTDHLFQLLQILLQRLADLRKMPCIILVEDLMLLPENDQLDRRRTDVHTDTKWGFQSNTTYPNPYKRIWILFN